MKNLPLACLFAAAALASLAPVQAQAEDAKPAQPAVEAQKPPAAKPEAAAPAVRVLDASAKKDDAPVSMNFDETPLADVIKAFRDATGANIISSGTNLQGTVSVRLDNVPWRKGLGSILEPQGLQLIEQPVNSGIYVVTVKTIEIPLVTRTFSLDNAKADEVAKLFTSTLGKTGTATPFPSANVVIVTATEQQVGECEKIIAAIDKPRAQVYIEARFVELTSSASRKLGMKWDSLAGWSVGVKNLGAGMEYNAGKVGTYGTGTETVKDSTSLLTGQTDKYVKEYVESVLVPDKIAGTSGEGTSGRSAESMSWNRMRGAGGQLTASAFNLTMSAFEQIDGVSVFSNPKIIVANEETARVDMTVKEPNVEVQATRSGTSSDQLDITTRLSLIPGKDEPFVGEAFFSYGISLKVTPRVSTSGLITVQIEPSISDKDMTQGDKSDPGYFKIGATATTPTAKYPIIKMNRIKTVFSMQSGTTAVIGGLSRSSENNVESGIPYLRSLPWIGPRLFGWKSREKEQKEIVIFVTVGVADPVNLKEDVGMPKNAILSRDILSGKTKEPGDRTIQDLMSLEEPAKAHPAKAAAEPVEKPAPGTAPAPAEPQPKNP